MCEWHNFVSWSVMSPFRLNMVMSETKGQRGVESCLYPVKEGHLEPSLGRILCVFQCLLISSKSDGITAMKQHRKHPTSLWFSGWKAPDSLSCSNSSSQNWLRLRRKKDHQASMRWLPERCRICAQTHHRAQMPGWPQQLLSRCCSLYVHFSENHQCHNHS